MNEDIAMAESQRETVANGKDERNPPLHVARGPATLVLLSLVAVVSFVAVSGLSRLYHAQQDALGNRWFSRGSADLKAQHYDRAVSEFRTALLYSRGNYYYQLNLAEALIGLRRTAEAHAYFVNLWEREPENGLVNLELARIAAQWGQTDQALRYYHNAIYAVWPGDQEGQRRDARLELIEFLLGANARAQAQSELIALAANLDDDPFQHARAGDLFLRAQDYEHALAEYRLSLKSERHNQAVLAGAGRAAFELGRYDMGLRYLQAAVSLDPGDSQSAALMKTAALVLQMDPFRRQVSVTERNQIVMEAFAVAGERLKACPSSASQTRSPAGGLQSLSENWGKMKPRMTPRSLRQDPDLAEAAMDLVFNIERQSSIACGAPTGTDLALLLIAKLHEGN